MRMFRLFGEGTRHLTRGAAILYRIWHRYVRLNCSTEAEAIAHYRKEKIDLFADLQGKGLSVKDIAGAIKDVPMSTLYRWRSRYRKWGMQGLVDKSRARHRPPPKTVRTAELKAAVLKIRQAHCWGKQIICEVLRRDGINVGSTTVGKIIAELRATGKITSSHAGKWAKARRRFTGWSQRQCKRPEVTAPGYLQIDHMKLSLVRHPFVIFAARDVFSNKVCAMSASNATAATACRFLDKVQTEFGFPLQNIQVDGGSEFRGVFEERCERDGLPLSVIPPRSPKHNSKIENLMGTLRREVFNFRDDIIPTVADIQDALDEFVDCYNRRRPNLALRYRDDSGRLRFYTPMEYIYAFYHGNPHSPA